MKRILVLLCMLPGMAFCQQTLSLKECVDLLAKNNLLYRQGNLQYENSEANLRQVKSQALPQIGIGFYNSINLGRSIDQYTNAYIDEVYNYSSLNANLSMPIYQAGRIQNQIRQNVLLKESAAENRTAVLNAQTVLLLQGYVNVLSTKALYESYSEQVASSEAQVNKVQKQVDAGVVGSNVLYEIKAQLANDKFDAVTALNNHKTARLALFQRMNVTPDNQIEFDTLTSLYAVIEKVDAEALFQSAQGVFPELKSADLYYKSFSYQVKSIRALNFPSLTLGANFGAFFASTNKSLDYFNQLNATRNGSLNVNLSIPIMGRWVTRPRVEIAKVQERLARNQMDISNQVLRQAMEQAVLDLHSTGDRYAAAQSQAESLMASYKVVESKLNAGTANIFEYSLAKANLSKAQANAIQAKYGFLMQQRLVQYYQNGNWSGIF